MKYEYQLTVTVADDMVLGVFEDFETLDTFGEDVEELVERAKTMLAVEILESQRLGLELPKASTKESMKDSLGEKQYLVTIYVDSDNYENISHE